MPIYMLLKNKVPELKTHHLIGGFAKPSMKSTDLLFILRKKIIIYVGKLITSTTSIKIVVRGFL